jgi:hypothetical protein
VAYFIQELSLHSLGKNNKIKEKLSGLEMSRLTTTTGLPVCLMAVGLRNITINEIIIMQSSLLRILSNFFL